MRLGSQRTLEGLKPVLLEPEAQAPEVVYWVFTDLTEEKWHNLTIINPDKMGKEFPKTFGHYHGTDVEETYHLIEGEGVLMLQKKYFEGKVWVPEKVEKVYLIKMKPNDEVVITPEWGHSWSNTGNLPLLSFDNWRSGHDPSDYADIEGLNGMAYYLISENNEIKLVANPNYKDLPEPEWITAQEFAHHKVIYPS